MPYYNSKNIIKSVRITDNTQQKIKRASQQASMKESDFMGRAYVWHALNSSSKIVILVHDTHAYRPVANIRQNPNPNAPPPTPHTKAIGHSPSKLPPSPQNPS